MDQHFYITTTLPYVNSKPHIGFAFECVQADSIARFQRLLGRQVIFNTGTDEHGQKIADKAVSESKTSQEFVDENSAHFADLLHKLNASEHRFIRTTDEHHKAAAQEFWMICDKNGDIYKKSYKTKYCVGCELEKTDSELVDDKCPLHPNMEIELRDEENYFFRFSKYQDRLLELYKNQPDFVVPESRLHEITEFVKSGLQDFSISRLKSKMSWGVPVPGDDTQVMYVWFDALVNYISTLGWRGNLQLETSNYQLYWPGVQIAGKDNLRQQSAIWQAMLMSAGLPPSKCIIIHGFITSAGAKMSKSLGNVVDPLEVIEKYSADALRCWMVKEANTFEDSDFTWEKFNESYTANLVNGVGNLVARVCQMAKTNAISIIPKTALEVFAADPDELHEFKKHMSVFNLKLASNWIWNEIRETDHYIQAQEPFKKIKTDLEAGKRDILYLLYQLEKLSAALSVIMPETGEKIYQALLNPDAEVPKLFPRL